MAREKHVYYVPAPLPTTIGPNLLEFLRREFLMIKGALDTFSLNMQLLAQEPERPQEGMLRYANGIDWDPGFGKGVYVYDGTGWVKL